MSDTRVVGVDGYREGWVAAVLEETGCGSADAGSGPGSEVGAGRQGEVKWTTYRRFESLLRAFPEAHIAVDIPIGLPSSGRRLCEDEARAFLGPARSSIFYTPPWWILTAYRLDGPHPRGIGVSIQTWNILPKVQDAIDALCATGHPRVTEVHPECSFRAMAGATKQHPRTAAAQLASKKTGRGRGQRIDLLQDHGAVTLPDLGAAPRGPAVDDLLDAAAAAWTARRWRTGSDDLIRFGTPASGQILA